MPSRISGQRHQENIESLRRLVDSGSQSVVRDALVGSAISGSRRRYPLPSIGQRNGKLTVTGYLQGERGGVNAIIARCDCSQAEYTVDPNNFKNFKSTRCNICAKQSSLDKRKKYWGYSEIVSDDKHRERLLNRINAVVMRTTNPNDKNFPNYGGRGIGCHSEWVKDRRGFLKYLTTLPGWETQLFELDRIDNNKGYEPGNLRFCSRKDNINNRRRVPEMQLRIAELEKEVADLRHRLRRAEEQVYDLDRLGAVDCA